MNREARESVSQTERKHEHVKRNFFIFNDICVDFYGRETSASSRDVPAVPSVNLMRGFGVSASLLPFSIMLVIICNSYARRGADVLERFMSVFD